MVTMKLFQTLLSFLTLPLKILQGALGGNNQNPDTDKTKK
jgi:hypothetical protein